MTDLLIIFGVQTQLNYSRSRMEHLYKLLPTSQQSSPGPRSTYQPAAAVTKECLAVPMPLDLTAVIITILRSSELGPKIRKQAYMAMQEPIANTHVYTWCGITMRVRFGTFL